MKHLNEDIHAKAREATARQTYKAIKNVESPDIVVAMILRALDEWFEKGHLLEKMRKEVLTAYENPTKSKEIG